MPHWEFARTEPVSLNVNSTAGSVAVTAEPTELVTVDVRPSRPGRHVEAFAGEVKVELTGDQLTIAEPTSRISWLRGTGLDIVIKVPKGSYCEGETVSAEMSCLGEFGSLNVKTASGPVRAATVTGDAEVTSISGLVAITAADTVTVSTASGPIELGEVTGALEATSVSGPVQVSAARGPVTIQSSSGSVSLGCFSRDTTQINTISGEVRVQVAPDTNVYLDLASISGKVSSELDPASEPTSPAGPDDPDEHASLQLHCTSVSGSIKISRAPSITPAQSASS